DLYVRGGHFAQVKGLSERFGQARVRDTPISEAAMVAAGDGSAMHGMRPVVDLNFADFAMGAMDEIVNQAAKMRYMFGAKVPLVIRGSSGVGLFAAQHTNSVESWFAVTAGLVVATPATPAAPRRPPPRPPRRCRRPARTGPARRRSRDLPHAQAPLVGARRGRRT